MKILLLGASKTGTTAMTYAIDEYCWFNSSTVLFPTINKLT